MEKSLQQWQFVVVQVVQPGTTETAGCQASQIWIYRMNASLTLPDLV
jgi:hypothetical protein